MRVNVCAPQDGPLAYIRNVRELLRQNPRFFLLVTLAGLALRLGFVFRFPGVSTDSLVYGDIARNWLQHGIYGVRVAGGIAPTWIRLPGYPAFLAAIFAIFGIDHYRAALAVQICVDLATCWLMADIARRVVSERAARVAFALAALCPFLADYAAAALTETLEIFFTTLALDLAIAGLEASDSAGLRLWLGCSLAVSGAVLLRPDGVLLLLACELFLFVLFFWNRLRSAKERVLNPRFRTMLILGVVSLAPLLPWTLRNLHAFGRFQPLVPRYANEADEFVPVGFNHWVKTWIADYVSVEEIYWQVPGNPLDVEKLPDRAFDSGEQDRTAQLLADYNTALHMSPALDNRFAALAAERVHHAPLRYYVWLPLMRITDMWLRPRTEKLPSDSRWWEFDDDPRWLALAIGLGIVNLLYVSAAIVGLFRVRFTAPLGLLLTFVVLRSAFLGTLENPESRYTLECYMVVIVLAAASFAEKKSRTRLETSLPD